jgi:Xaa-Pro aminopeptidase
MQVMRVLVPQDFGGAFADHLRALKYKLVYKEPPFYEERAFKTPAEVREVKKVMATTERAMKRAIDVIRKSTVRNNALVYGGAVLTSERLRTMIHLDLMAGGCVADLNSIVACGEHTADPHEVGKGPLRPNRPIILDLFPRSMESGYYGDITRTVVKGKASAQLKKMYKAVFEAVEVARAMYKPNMHGPAIFRAVHNVFESYGFKSGEIRGRRQGFIHGVGHGLGLNIHEEPSVGSVDRQLKPGHLVTLEPGLYYRGVGGVRIEELYLITKTGSQRITRMPHVFEVG